MTGKLGVAHPASVRHGYPSYREGQGHGFALIPFSPLCLDPPLASIPFSHRRRHATAPHIAAATPPPTASALATIAPVTTAVSIARESAALAPPPRKP